MYRHGAPSLPSLADARLLKTSLSLIGVCFIAQALGCAHQTTEPASPTHKPSVLEKRGASSPADASQSVKPATQRQPVQKEKKPGNQPESSQEPTTDTFIPPPPLKPPTFGGAGG